MGHILYGTSNWSAKGWVGPFYPARTKPADFLPFYATQFPVVECDATYYRVPDERLVRGWETKVPDGFRLCAKFPRSIVHGGSDRHPNPDVLLNHEHVGRDLHQFLASMALLGPKCGPLLLQFPYFNRQAFPGPTPFLAKLREFLRLLPNGFQYVVEVRNRNWIRPPLLDLLRKHGVALALVEHAFMPHPDELLAEFDVLTARFTYCRLIGDRKVTDAKTSTFDSLVIEQTERLKRWATLLEQLKERVVETYLLANNHYAGHGPATIRELVQLMDSA